MLHFSRGAMPLHWWVFLYSTCMHLYIASLDLHYMGTCQIFSSTLLSILAPPNYSGTCVTYTSGDPNFYLQPMANPTKYWLNIYLHLKLEADGQIRRFWFMAETAGIVSHLQGLTLVELNFYGGMYLISHITSFS